IDDLTFTNTQTSILSDVIAGDSYACDNRLPYVSDVESQSVTEGASVSLAVTASDANGDDLTYSWVETSGSGVTLAGADTAQASFTAPQISAATELEFAVTVSDGIDSVVKSVTVSVADVPAPVATTPAKKSSGGSTSWLALLLLPMAALRRRK
ncbi:MAG: GlyGly-CTERM sorting domain-containing protein, partial [Alteromonadales bacterium]|nr:GlyGly-CTERM sorting domain-containing protein [Alteromonadales bacterium]